jgi:phage-related protein
MADGRIIIDTQIDGSGAEKGMKSLSGKLGGLASNALGVTAKVTAAMVTAASGAVAALATLSIKQYAEYEQLVGGVETLFKDSSSEVMEYANNAYKTAGMSANEYMSTITGFSASLLQGLGGDTKKSAEIGNKAVIDMSDNANKMGTAIGDIQNAYQGFAKQNYTMLDNLKLGYGGTKTEMERLLVDAEKLTGIKYNIENFSDIIEAIHAIQDEMGITGTTAIEASETIEGSMNMTKSAWNNLLTGMADDNANFDVLVDNLVNSLGSLAENLLPRVKIAIEGIGELVRTLLPKVLDEIPEMLASLFPESMQEDIKTIFEGIVEAIKTTANVAMQWLPKITEGFAWILDNGPQISIIIGTIAASVVAFKAAAVITSVVQSWQKAKVSLALYKMTADGATISQGVMNGVFTIWETIVALITGKTTLAAVATGLWTKATAALNAMWAANPIGIVIVAIVALVGAFIYLWNTSEGFRDFFINAWNMIKAGFIAGWNGMIAFFTETIPSWIESIKTWFSSLGEWFGTLWTNIKQFFVYGWNSIVTFFTESIPMWWEGVKQAFADGWNAIVSFFTETIPAWLEQMFNWFCELPDKIAYGLGFAAVAIYNWTVDAIETFIQCCANIIYNVTEWFMKLPGVIWEWLVNAYNKIVEWSTNTWNKFVETCANVYNAVTDWFSKLPGVIWNWLKEAINKAVQWGQETYWKMVEAVANAVNAVIEWFAKLPGRIWEWLLDTISKVIQFGKDLGSKAREAGGEMVENITDAVKDLPRKFMEIGVNIVKGIWEGIKSVGSWLHDKVSGFFENMLQGAKDANEIKSPSRLYRDQVGKYMAQGVGVGFEDEADNVQKSMEKDFNRMASKMQLAIDYNMASTTAGIVASRNYRNPQQSVTNNNDNGITQNVTIVNPERTPSENARALKKVGRDLGFGY